MRRLKRLFEVGNRCTVTSKTKGNRSGLIAFVGEVDFKPDEIMVGVVLDEVYLCSGCYLSVLASWETRWIC